MSNEGEKSDDARIMRAVLKAVKEIPFVLKIDAAASAPGIKEEDGHIIPSGEADSEDWKENVKGFLLPCYNSSEGQPLDRIIISCIE